MLEKFVKRGDIAGMVEVMEIETEQGITCRGEIILGIYHDRRFLLWDVAWLRALLCGLPSTGSHILP